MSAQAGLASRARDRGGITIVLDLEVPERRGRRRWLKQQRRRARELYLLACALRKLRREQRRHTTVAHGNPTVAHGNTGERALEELGR